MALAAGSSLGPYEILGPLGAGGMGQVYKARDTRLNRTVAIKVLPEHLAAYAEARQRFEREAQAIASLNHPNICVLHDVGRAPAGGAAVTDVTPPTPVDFLVMEHLEGMTLAERLTRGPLSPAEALAIALQIADALDAAHRSGIVHRDLKPANIFLVSGASQTAKLLDFGLARPGGAVRPAAADPLGSIAPTIGPTAAPTVSSPLTAQGTILGTFQYMAPEQVEGQEADARADIFAFGAVLYEMLTGRLAFEGTSHASTMAAILATDPPELSTLVPVSPHVDHVIRRCLAKAPANRWQSIRDVALELQSAADARDPLSVALAGATTARPATTLPSRRVWLAIGAATAVLMAAAAAAGVSWRAAPPDPHGVRFELSEARRPFRVSVSPDGRTVAYNAPSEDGRMAIWIRPLDSLDARLLVSVASGNPNHDWSPDSRALVYNAPDGTLKRIDIAGGSPQTIAALPQPTTGYQRAAWGHRGTIVFSNGGALYRVPAGGGEAVQISEPDISLGETFHATPSFLPDGRHFVYTAWSITPENRALYLASIDAGDSAGSVDVARAMAARVRLMTAESKGVYVEPGYLLFLRDRRLMARPFDAGRRAFTGEARPVAENVAYNPTNGAAAFQASDGGTILYARASDVPAADRSREWRWIDRDTGAMSGPVGAPHGAWHVALSRDGTRIAFTPAPGDGSDIWIHDTARNVRTRLTADRGADLLPVWSPDDTRIVFMSTRAVDDEPPVEAGGRQRGHLYLAPASGAVPERLLLANPPGVQVAPADWSADGRSIVAIRVVENAADRNNPQIDLWVVPAGGGDPFEYLATPFVTIQPSLSPDGRWLAYASNESGTPQVVVQPFPDPSGGKWQISSDSGIAPRWRRDGRELYYLNRRGEIVAVPVTAGDRFDFGTPLPLFTTTLPFAGSPNGVDVPYDVTADGQRFLLSLPIETPEQDTPLTVVTGWRAAWTR